MAFSLKKWIGSMLFSTFMDEYNENLEEIEGKFGEVDYNLNALIESGSNENGHYFKYANGWVEMWHKDAANLNGVSANGYIDLIWDLPVEVLEESLVAVGTSRGSGALEGNVNVTFVGALANTDTLTWRIYLMNKTAAQSNCIIAMKAIGRWKE